MSDRWQFSPLPRRGLEVVVIDPPWRWQNRTIERNQRSPESRYRTMTLPRVAELPVAELLDRRRGFALVWCTWPLLAEQAKVVQDAWGLSIRTGGCWVKRTREGKQRVGTGFIFRSVCEPFLVASLGNCGGLRGRGERNLVETFDDLALDGVARKHSQKPDEFYALVERMTPGWRRADVFARDRRPGWACWGEQLVGG